MSKVENQKVELVDFVVTARKYKTTLTAKYKKRIPWKKPVEGEVKSVLPGTVLSIHVEAGAQVEIGDLLLIQEAMKMQNRILSPIKGTVRAIHVAAGERVSKDVVMVTVE